MDEPCVEVVDEGPCAAGPDQLMAGLDQFASLPELERMRVLAALTARFSSLYLRWMRAQAGEDLTYSNVRVLEMLEAGGPTIMRDIANSLSMTARNMTAIVDTLEDGGLVRRTPHPHDRRATVVELTAEGRSQAAQARCDSVAWVAEAFGSLTVEEQQQYAELLRRLAGYFCH